MKNIFLVIIVLSTVIFIGCSKGGSKKQTGQEEQQQLNVTIVLDLSDRITKSDAQERDISIVKNVLSEFKKDMESRKPHKANGSIQVLFYPQPTDPNIVSIAEGLNVNLEGKNKEEKKSILNNIEKKFTTNLEQIYQLALQNKVFPGSDIWSFFKDEINIHKKENHRNIVVVLTDGYVYYETTLRKENHRYSYLLPKNLKQEGLRSNNWEQRIDDLDFGLISERSDLKNVEVLFLELNPDQGQQYDYDIMKKVLAKWCKEMGIKKVESYKTDLPVNSKKVIESFFKR